MRLHMQIRAITNQDLIQLAKIEEASQLAPWSQEVFQRCWEANYPGWVLESEENLAAFILISMVSGECHILNLCVHPNYQRQGFGHKLMEFALSWAKQQGAGIVYLEVRHSNNSAISLYRKMNFKQIGERKNYYASKNGREDALIFARDLGME